MDLKTKLEARIRAAEKTIASKQATIARAKADLADLDKAEGRLTKQREKKNKKPAEVPAVGSPAAGVAGETVPGPVKEKKSSWLF